MGIKVAGAFDTSGMDIYLEQKHIYDKVFSDNEMKKSS